MRLSYSTINLFKNCERWFYYNKIMKEKPTEQTDTKYADFGRCVHELLEKEDELTDEILNKYWNKYNLEGKCFNKMDIKNQFNYVKSLNLDIVKKEEIIHLDFEDQKLIGIIDAILKDNTIVDYKTSSYTIKKQKEYEEQVKFYAWMVYKKFGIIPPKVMLIFTKNKQRFEKEITKDDIIETENKVKNIINQIKLKNTFSDYNKNENNCRFCPYKTKCFEDTFKNNKEVVVNLILTDNRIKIKTDKFLQQKIDKVLDDKLSYEIDNKFYVIKAMKQKGIDFDGIIHLYRNSSTYLGFKNYIIDLLQKDLKEYLEKNGYKLNIKIIDKRNCPNIGVNLNCKKLNNIELRDYQKEVIEKAIKEEITILGLCTSAGKTVIASEIIRRLNYKTLFVVNTIDLLNQAKRTFENTMNVEVGTITNGKAEWKDITVATIQTIIKYLKNKDKEFLKHLHECNLVIVDECHISKAKSYSLLMDNIKARYRIGLSATPYAYGNNSLEIYKSFGFPKIVIGLQDLIKLGYLTKPIIKFIKYEHKEHYFDYDDAYNGCLLSEERLNKLKEIVEKHKNDYIMIIVRRLEHADIIKDLLGDNVEIIKGSISKKKRENLLNEMREGKRNILIGTDKIVSTGLDLPILNVLINYSANLTTIQTIQSLGRILRLHPNKNVAYFYDFYDTNEYLKKATKERINTLKEQGFNVDVINKP